MGLPDVFKLQIVYTHHCDRHGTSGVSKELRPVFSFQGGGQYQGRSATKMTVHRGMVMAYRMKKLVIKDKHCSEQHLRAGVPSAAGARAG